MKICKTEIFLIVVHVYVLSIYSCHLCYIVLTFFDWDECTVYIQNCDNDKAWNVSNFWCFVLWCIIAHKTCDQLQVTATVYCTTTVQYHFVFYSHETIITESARVSLVIKCQQCPGGLLIVTALALLCCWVFWFARSIFHVI